MLTGWISRGADTAQLGTLSLCLSNTALTRLSDAGRRQQARGEAWRSFDMLGMATLKALGHFEVLLANTTKYKATSDPPVFMAPRSECATPRHTTLLLLLLFSAVCLLCACASPYLRNSGCSLLQKGVLQVLCATNHRGTEGSTATQAVITLNLGTRLSGVLGRHSREWPRLRVWCHDPQQLNEGCLGRPDCLRRHQSCGGRSVSWHHEGKQLVCCHTDGALTTWNLTQTSPTPTSNIFHYGKPRVIIHSSTCTLAAPGKCAVTCVHGGHPPLLPATPPARLHLASCGGDGLGAHCFRLLQRLGQRAAWLHHLGPWLNTGREGSPSLLNPSLARLAFPNLRDVANLSLDSTLKLNPETEASWQHGRLKGRG
ncbi:hypothetical protein O3P69_018671 [Scylla paramamosain]|uniref:Uncharacterized protein n=1 Tax=Scylla paramamosain TaxID=85552 RepID=A0AAW0SG62_SCYPA